MKKIIVISLISCLLCLSAGCQVKHENKSDSGNKLGFETEDETKADKPDADNVQVDASPDTKSVNSDNEDEKKPSDLSSGEIIIGNAKITLPCPYKEIEDAGFGNLDVAEYYDCPLKSHGCASNAADVTNQSGEMIILSFYNPSAEEKNLNECMVYGINSGNHGNSPYTEIAGVKMGMSQKEVKSILGKPKMKDKIDVEGYQPLTYFTYEPFKQPKIKKSQVRVIRSKVLICFKGDKLTEIEVVKLPTPAGE